MPRGWRRQSAELGAKLSLGFEILLSLAAADGDGGGDGDDDGDGGGPSAEATGEAWEAFVASLESRGYFRGELRGSRLHTELMRAAADGAIIVLATHQPSRFQGLLTHVGSMAAGRLAPLVPLSKDRVELSLEVEQGIDLLLSSLLQLEGLVVVATRPSGCSVQIEHAHVPALARCCVPYGLRSMEMVFPPTVGTTTHG